MNVGRTFTFTSGADAGADQRGFCFAEGRSAAQVFFVIVRGGCLLLQLRQSSHDLGLWTLDFGLNFGSPIRQRPLHDVADLRDLIDAHERIHFRKQLGQLITEPLRQTAGNDQRLAAIARLAHFAGFQDGIHALLLRRVDERAGVHDHGVRARGIVRDFHAALEQRAEHDLRVHQVLGATEGNHADAQRTLLISLGHSEARKLRQKHQTPNTKHQQTSQLKTPILPDRQRRCWCLFGVWCLDFGAWASSVGRQRQNLSPRFRRLIHATPKFSQRI